MKAASGWSEENVKAAEALAAGSVGPELTKVFGAGGGGSVVKRQERSAGMRLPTTSATPAAPPLIVTV